MRRFFNILLGALAMIAVALASAFLTMRLAIHGREVEVPNLSGLTVQEAHRLALAGGLNFALENRFYSTITTAGRVLSQSPSPGTKVRHDWTVRVTESLGPQKASVPNVVGLTEREAAVAIRRLSLDLGTVAYLPVSSAPGIVLTQTPTPAAAGIDGPRISLLVSEPEGVPHHRTLSSDDPTLDASPSPPGAKLSDTPAATPPSAISSSATLHTASDAASATSPGSPTAQPSTPTATATPAEALPAFVMPNLIGLTLTAASTRVSAMGLHITSMEAASIPMRPIASVPSPATPNTTPDAATPAPAPIRPIAPLAPITLSNTVVAQSPAPGHRVTRADPIHITLSR